jgi:hypothetical protein
MIVESSRRPPGRIRWEGSATPLYAVGVGATGGSANHILGGGEFALPPFAAISWRRRRTA